MNTLGESSLSKEMDAPKSLVCLTHIKRPFFVLPDELERMRERQYSGCGSAACGNPRVHSLFCVMTTEGVVLCESIRQKKNTHMCVCHHMAGFRNRPRGVPPMPKKHCQEGGSLSRISIYTVSSIQESLCFESLVFQGALPKEDARAASKKQRISSKALRPRFYYILGKAP